MEIIPHPVTASCAAVSQPHSAGSDTDQERRHYSGGHATGSSLSNEADTEGPTTVCLAFRASLSTLRWTKVIANFSQLGLGESLVCELAAAATGIPTVPPRPRAHIPLRSRPRPQEGSSGCPEAHHLKWETFPVTVALLPLPKQVAQLHGIQAGTNTRNDRRRSRLLEAFSQDSKFIDNGCSALSITSLLAFFFSTYFFFLAEFSLFSLHFNFVHCVWPPLSSFKKNNFFTHLPALGM